MDIEPWVVTAVISAISAAAAVYVAARGAMRDKESDKEELTARITAIEQSLATIRVKIDALAEHVNRHNNVIERTYQLESELNTIKNEHERMHHNDKI